MGKRNGETARLLTAGMDVAAHLPDVGGVLGPDEHKETHAHQLLRGQQNVLMIPGNVLLQLSGPQLLVGRAERG